MALDETGRPSFNLLQNVGSFKAKLVFYVFEVLILGGRDVMHKAASTRRMMLRDRVLPMLKEPVRESGQFEASFLDLLEAVKANGFEGIVAKRLDSTYEPGQRSEARRKMRVSQGPGVRYRRVQAKPEEFRRPDFRILRKRQAAVRRRDPERVHAIFPNAAMSRFRPLEIQECPFANLPETPGGRWGEGLAAEEMKEDCLGRCWWASSS